VQPIDLIDDPRVAAYRGMKDRALRGESLFVAEGRLLVDRLLDSPFAVESVFASEELAAEYAARLTDEVPLYVAPEALLREVVGYKFHRGVLAAGRRDRPMTLDRLTARLDDRRRWNLVVCPRVANGENLGLIFRSAAALGIDGVLLGPHCADPLSRRCLRLSMGGVLRVPTVHSADLAADLRHLRDHCNVRPVATVVDARAEPLRGFSWPPRTALLLGSEFEGLDDPWLALCDRQITIPMQPGSDSLNLGVAAGIFLYEMSQGG